MSTSALVGRLGGRWPQGPCTPMVGGVDLPVPATAWLGASGSGEHAVVVPPHQAAVGSEQQEESPLSPHQMLHLEARWS